MVVALAAMVFCACSTTVDPNYYRLLEVPLDAPSANTLGPGDKIEIRVYGEEKMGGEFVVAPGGTVGFPLVGKVTVADLTCSGVEDLLTQRLKAGYIRNPSVTCSVLEFESKKIAVLGEVKKPGNFRFVDQMTVLQAVADAGGFTDRASENDTTVVRVVQGEKLKAKVPMAAIIAGEVENLQLLPDDLVVVPQTIY